MKTTRRTKRPPHGAALLAALILCTIFSLVLMYYLMLVQQQNGLSVRSQSWNMAMAVAEAGIEDGLEQLNSHPGMLDCDGWHLLGTAYYRSNALPDGSSYEVYITNGLPPSVYSRAYVQTMTLSQAASHLGFATIGLSSLAPTVASRAVVVTCTNGGMFVAALVAKHGINMNGNDVLVDSFNSQDPNMSTNGLYTASKAGDHGDIASNDGLYNTINVGNANIYGRAHTGHGNNTVSIGPNGAVGSHAWQASNTGTAQSGWSLQDANFSFPVTAFPNTSTYLSPTNGTYNGVSYDHILAGATGPYTNYYVASNLSGKTIITGSNVVVALPNGLDMDGGDVLTIASQANVVMYVGGSSCTVRGNGILNLPGFASSLMMFCAPSVTSLTLDGNGSMAGVVVAPNAAASLNGSGNSTAVDFSGILMVSSAVLNGHFNFHYDEALRRYTTNSRYIVSSWNEVP